MKATPNAGLTLSQTLRRGSRPSQAAVQTGGVHPPLGGGSPISSKGPRAPPKVTQLGSGKVEPNPDGLSQTGGLSPEGALAPGGQ